MDARWLRLSKDDFGWVARRPDIAVHISEPPRRTTLPPPALQPSGTAGTFRTSYSSAPLFVVTIEEATVLSPGGYVITHDQLLVRETATRRADGEQAYAGWRATEHPAERWADDSPHPPLLVSTQRHDNFFHWWLDVLPRVWFAERLGRVSDQVLIFPPLRHAFQVESLKALGIAHRAREIPAGATSFAALDIAQGLSFGAAQNVSPHVPAYAEWLRGRLGTEEFGGRARRLYIGRHKAQRRRVVDSRDVDAALAARGFVSLDLEDLALAQQRAAFHQADVVVAAHGAGLANLLFAQAGALVVELFPFGGVHDSCYRSLAYQMGLRYACVEGVMSGAPSANPLNDDLSIDARVLAAGLDELID